jgi:hypothetical protein
MTTSVKGIEWNGGRKSEMTDVVLQVVTVARTVGRVGTGPQFRT